MAPVAAIAAAKNAKDRFIWTTSEFPSECIKRAEITLVPGGPCRCDLPCLALANEMPRRGGGPAGQGIEVQVIGRKDLGGIYPRDPGAAFTQVKPDCTLFGRVPIGLPGGDQSGVGPRSRRLRGSTNDPAGARPPTTRECGARREGRSRLPATVPSEGRAPEPSATGARAQDGATHGGSESSVPGTAMLRATALIRRAAVKTERIADTVTLDHEARTLRRRALTGENGLKVMVELKREMVLNDGDALTLDDGRLLGVKAAPQRLL